VPRFTEDPIRQLFRQLCSQAVAADTEDKIDKIAEQLRFALEEHIRLARESLNVRATTIPLIISPKTKRK
jgi:hypothetical protein